MNKHQRYAANHPERVRAKDKRIKDRNRSTPSGQLLYILQNRRGWAKKVGIFFDDTLLDLAKHPPVNCPCCGKPIIYGTGKGQNERSPSIDRVVAAGQYTIDNTVIVCQRCNTIKNEGTIVDHSRVITYMDQHHRGLVNGTLSRVEQRILAVKASISQLNSEELKQALARSRSKPRVPRLRPWWHFDWILRNAKARAFKTSRVYDDSLYLLSQDPLEECACCNTRLNYEPGYGQNPLSASIDCVDPSDGYTGSNVDILCMRCNGIKNDGTIADHKMVIAYMIEHAKQHQK